MFSFKPVEKSQADKLFNEQNLQITDTSMAVIAVNSNQDGNYGYCLFDYNDLTVLIYTLEYSQEYSFLPECLVKAALNFAANRGAYIAECSNMSVKDDLIKLGFKEKNNILCCEIPKIMVGTCNCCKGNISNEIDKAL